MAEVLAGWQEYATLVVVVGTIMACAMGFVTRNVK
jgi:hypothetical protein